MASYLPTDLRQHADACDQMDRGYSANLLRRAADEIESRRQTERALLAALALWRQVSGCASPSQLAERLKKKEGRE